MGPHRYRHIVSRSLIGGTEGGETAAVTPFVVFQMRTDPIDFGKVETYALGEYRDVYVRTGEGLRLRKRLVVLDNLDVKDAAGYAALTAEVGRRLTPASATVKLS